MIEKSEWKYETSASGGLAMGDILASGGKFVLESPDRKLHAVNYAGVGLGFGWRMPEKARLPDLVLPRSKAVVSGTGATTDFLGRGAVFRFRKEELLPSDFTGITLYVDLGAGLLVAGGGTGLLIGVKEHALIPRVVNPGLFANAMVSSAHVFVRMPGMSEGLIDGASGACQQFRV
ncbi:hypothetical protein QCE63_29920 [Caballeronia sp. LZ065]|uniref:hypothetical protein n=1 Tax=Caballeronia sp. LZ065 TaxID=3038571 RepID=UPI0028650B49|nr:hypothetical protein [Caballeronia sp. LZ065]MDR5783635.1 hypothetical protein [Caballeronia sp. LZ065]